MGGMEICLQMAFGVWVAHSDGTRAAPMGTTKLGGMMGPRVPGHTSQKSFSCYQGKTVVS